MPDANKFAKLQEIGYTIPVTCGLCVEGCFPDRGDWGTCRKHLYQHLKHTGEPRGVSIHRSGTCKDAVQDSKRVLDSGFGAHVQFLTGGQNEQGEDS